MLYKCPMQNCSLSYKSLEVLFNHLNRTHDIISIRFNANGGFEFIDYVEFTKEQMKEKKAKK